MLGPSRPDKCDMSIIVDCRERARRAVSAVASGSRVCVARIHEARLLEKQLPGRCGPPVTHGGARPAGQLQR
eukprot:scaffold20057_cov61-Phaeocystis_antarctica.AAC.2